MSGIGHSSFCQLVPEIKSGEGFEYYMSSEPHFSDLMCGTSCTGLGYNSEVQRRIFDRVRSLPLNTYDYPTVFRRYAIEELQLLYPGYQFAFLNGGAEAVEAAIKIAMDLTKKFKKVVAFQGCFHGKTYLTNLLTQNINSDLTRIEPYNTSFSIPEDTVAVVVEPFQCRNGVKIPNVSFFEKLSNYCTEKNILLIDDEISTTIRSGYSLAINRFLSAYRPSIICLGKNIGQGIPVSIVGVINELADKVKVSLTSGFGGNALSCIAVEETLRYIRENQYLEKIRERGKEFLDYLKELEFLEEIEEVRGFGMWFGISFKSKELSDFVSKCLLKNRLIVGDVPPNIRLAPPFDLPVTVWKGFINSVKECLR